MSDPTHHVKFEIQYDDDVTHEMTGGRQDCNVLDWLQSAEWFETYGGPDGETPKDGPIHVGWANEDTGFVWWLDGTERAV